MNSVVTVHSILLSEIWPGFPCRSGKGWMGQVSQGEGPHLAPRPIGAFPIFCRAGTIPKPRARGPVSPAFGQQLRPGLV